MIASSGPFFLGYAGWPAGARSFEMDAFGFHLKRESFSIFKEETDSRL
jgi:hypothetical protein